MAAYRELICAAQGARLVVAAAFAVMAGAGAAAQEPPETTLHTGPERSSAHAIFAPRLADTLEEVRTLRLIPSRGTADNIAAVAQDPTSVGFAQYDIYRRIVDGLPEGENRLEFYGDVPVCILAVARIGGPWLLPPAEIPEDLMPAVIDIGPEGSDTAVGLAPLIATAPKLSGARVEHRGGARALSRLRQRAADIVFLMEYPHKKTPIIADVFEAPDIGFIEDTAAFFAGAQSDVKGAFIPTKILVPGGGVLSGRSEIDTVCTPLGVVVHGDGDSDTLDFVVSSVTGGSLIDSGDGFLDRLWNAAARLWRGLVGWLAGLFG